MCAKRTHIVQNTEMALEWNGCQLDVVKEYSTTKIQLGTKGGPERTSQIHSGSEQLASKTTSNKAQKKKKEKKKRGKTSIETFQQEAVGGVATNGLTFMAPDS